MDKHIVGLLLLIVSTCMLMNQVHAQRVILSMTSISQTPFLYNGYFTPDIKNRIWNWVGTELQGNTNPYHGEISIPIQGFDPIIYRGHLSANTNFVSNTYPFALMSVAVTPNSFNGTLSIEGAMQCGDIVTLNGAVGGTRFQGIAIDGRSNNCFTYNCRCSACKDSFTVAMSVCYQPITPSPSYFKKE